MESACTSTEWRMPPKSTNDTTHCFMLSPFIRHTTTPVAPVQSYHTHPARPSVQNVCPRKIWDWQSKNQIFESLGQSTIWRITSEVLQVKIDKPRLTMRMRTGDFAQPWKFPNGDKSPWSCSAGVPTRAEIKIAVPTFVYVLSPRAREGTPALQRLGLRQAPFVSLRWGSQTELKQMFSIDLCRYCSGRAMDRIIGEMFAEQHMEQRAARRDLAPSRVPPGPFLIARQ